MREVIGLNTRFKQLLQQYGLVFWKRYYSHYMAVVTDNNDPEQLCRVQVMCPAVWGGTAPKLWVPPINQYSGSGYGEVKIPRIDQPLLLMFEEGDPSHPVYLYDSYGISGIPEQAKTNYPDTEGRYFEDGTFDEYDRKEQRKQGAIGKYLSYTTTEDEASFTYGDMTVTINQDELKLNHPNGMVNINKENILLEHGEGVVTVSSGGFSFKDKAGTELGDLWKDTLDAITKLTVPTAMGPSGTPMNAASFVAVIQKLGKFFP